MTNVQKTFRWIMEKKSILIIGCVIIGGLFLLFNNQGEDHVLMEVVGEASPLEEELQTSQELPPVENKTPTA
jgi:hypothetical protein